MILLDAIYINNGGGKILLDYLIEKLYQSNKDVFYLLDQRVKGDYTFLPNQKVRFLESSIIQRHFFYLNNSEKFSSVLCFGNFPPTIRLKSKVFTYFHNSIYFFTSRKFSARERLLIKFKSFIIKAFKNNTDLWWVQTDDMLHLFIKFWKISSHQVEVLPFFSFVDILNINQSKRENNTFIYISDGHPNKNHLKLLEALIDVHRLYPNTKLYLTISSQYPDLINKIHTLQEEGYGVVNLGWCNSEDLGKLYSNSGFFIFPSNQESFGLGLIEAAQYGMKILASDMPYVHAVIKPSLTFNPENEATITEAMITAMNKELPNSKLLVKNQINELLVKLK